MHNPNAISFKNVTKVYKLHANKRDQLIDVLGLEKLGITLHKKAKEYSALKNVSLDIPLGHRIGIIGRNGAGKTTLLKLICGNFKPTSGSIAVSGTVQALMNVGLGFHPEYTGRENVKASLQFNDLSETSLEEAMNDIIDFCELGEYIDQPFKSYSLGMQARLMFASATAIKPKILIIDEILGAGDAYFIAKSKTRIENLISTGCTMLLVSHSMQQILELCNEVIWLENGKIKMRGDSFSVVKAFEEDINRPKGNQHPSIAPLLIGSHHKVNGDTIKSVDLNGNDRTYILPDIPIPSTLKFHSAGGISRWKSDPGLKVCALSICTERGEGNLVQSLRPAKLVMVLVAEMESTFSCRYGLVIDNESGECVSKIFSPTDNFFIKKGETRIIEILLNPVQLGAGTYTLGISILGATPIENINYAPRYDLLGRSFNLVVENTPSMEPINCKFSHSAKWQFTGI